MTSKDNNSNISDKRSTQTFIGAVSAAGRAFIYRLMTFYLRTPLKLFRPARFDYLHYIRAAQAKELATYGSKIYQNNSVYILSHALSKYGWKVIPEKVLPPLLTNSITGVVLYTTYLQTLWVLNKDKTRNDKEYYHNIYKAGFLAGTAQAMISTPIDAIFARSSTDEIISQMTKYDNLWKYGWDKWRQIGLIGCYGGFFLTFVKESLGFATYFWMFEYIKDKYRDYFEDSKYIKRSIIFVAGVTAAFFLQVIQFPFSKIEKIHFRRLEVIDTVVTTQRAASKLNKIKTWEKRHFHLYRNAYKDTFNHLKTIHGGKNTRFVRWLYKGFMRNTIAVIPGTTAGLLFLNYLKTQMEDLQTQEQLETLQ